MEHYLTGDYLLYEYEPATITTVLSHFTPDRVNIITLSPTYTAQCRLKERWFGTRYCVEGEGVWHRCEEGVVMDVGVRRVRVGGISQITGICF